MFKKLEAEILRNSDTKSLLLSIDFARHSWNKAARNHNCCHGNREIPGYQARVKGQFAQLSPYFKGSRSVNGTFRKTVVLFEWINLSQQRHYVSSLSLTWSFRKIGFILQHSIFNFRIVDSWLKKTRFWRLLFCNHKQKVTKIREILRTKSDVTSLILRVRSSRGARSSWVLFTGPWSGGVYRRRK